MADRKEPTTGIMVKIPDSRVAQIDEIAEVFGITRARFVAWAAEEAVDKALTKLADMRALREGLPGVPVAEINRLLR